MTNRLITTVGALLLLAVAPACAQPISPTTPPELYLDYEQKERMFVSQAELDQIDWKNLDEVDLSPLNLGEWQDERLLRSVRSGPMNYETSRTMPDAKKGDCYPLPVGRETAYGAPSGTWSFSLLAQSFPVILAGEVVSRDVGYEFWVGGAQQRIVVKIDEVLLDLDSDFTQGQLVVFFVRGGTLRFGDRELCYEQPPGLRLVETGDDVLLFGDRDDVNPGTHLSVPYFFPLLETQPVMQPYAILKNEPPLDLAAIAAIAQANAGSGQ